MNSHVLEIYSPIKQFMVKWDWLLDDLLKKIRVEQEAK